MSVALSLLIHGVVLTTPPEGFESVRDLAARADVEGELVQPRPIRPEDYARFERLGGVRLSPDGRWLTCDVSRVDGDGELRIRHLATDSTDVVTGGRGARFSGDGTWLAYAIAPSEDEAEKLRKRNEQVRTALGLRNLITGDEITVDDVASFAFSEDGAWLAMRRYAPKSGGAAALVVRDLETGVDTRFGDVSAYAWADDRPLLAMTVSDEDDAANGVRVYEPGSGRLRTLDSADARYEALRWREDADDLAVLRRIEYDDNEDEDRVVLCWRGVGGDEPRRFELDPETHDGVPDDHAIASAAGVRWSDDGTRVFVGVKPWVDRPVARGGEPVEIEKDESDTLRATLVDDPSNVEVWHTRDVDIIPRQKRLAGRDRSRTRLATWSLEDDAFVVLANDVSESVRLLDGHRHAVALDNTPHDALRMFGPTLNDVAIVDVATGERERILEAIKYDYGGSPDGRWFLYQRDGDVWTYDIVERAHRNITAGIDAQFINQEESSLTDEKSIYGTGGWTADSSRVLLYDRFDMWLVNADGTGGERLTDGAALQTRHRRLVLDRDDDEYVPTDEPMYVSLYGETTKQSGFGRVRLGERVEHLIYDDARLGGLTRADDAERFAFTAQRFDDPQDVYVAGPDLDEIAEAVATNEFFDEFQWGSGTLVDYENLHGEPLQGALYTPAGFDPNESYPMIVYIYERMSQNLHRFLTPAETSAYNAAVFTSQGYFVYMPDIVYRPQNPGLSAKECLEPAVAAALASNASIDADRVGLVGHSWGAYQTAFMATHSDIFAAGVAGAPLTNMISMSMSIYWNSGQTDAWIFHESQGRMDQPFWNDLETYIANSPIFGVENMQTPLLVAFGDEDGAVDWQQGVEMYNAARLAGAPLVMLVYPGENHGLRREPNQIDYHYRILEWFGHHLKGDPAPKWMTDGVPHLERQRELELGER